MEHVFVNTDQIRLFIYPGDKTKINLDYKKPTLISNFILHYLKEVTNFQDLKIFSS